MTEFTRPATWEDVKRLCALLEAEHTEYALIGGYAIAAHGYVRFSEDVDILVEPSPENARRWISALSHLPDEAAKELAGQEQIFQHEGLKEGARDKDRADAAVLRAALEKRRPPRD